MATTVSMPQLGETVTEGTVLRWAKKVGDSIAEDEVLVEISTDKVDTEVPSPIAGTILEILVAEGDTVEVGIDLVVISEAEEQPSSATPAETVESAAEPAPEPQAGSEPELHPAAETPAGPDTGFEASSTSDVTQTPPTDAEVEAFFAEPSAERSSPQLLSPVVRRLVRENEIDLAQIQGTGQGGRITRQDVETYMAAAPTTAPVAPAAVPEPVVSAPASSEEVAQPTRATPTPAVGVGSEEVELDRIRVRIAENMIKSKQTAAHVWTSVEVDFERVERVRQAHKARFKSDEGFSLTYLPFISRATIDALKAFPVVNSSFYLEEKKAVFHKKVDLGIAIDLNQGGLVVARVRNADGLRLVGIARDIRALAERGRDGKLDLDDLTGSTFT
ncbi:MAG: dihydrolipoamide acetyltransferase family protein, partial [Actinobacteria bacterium]|nr:dihydrolipoamide acetyltransferase family protein [Actinomycetota bacterium]